jgi:glycosyltransferase involved in cell wall biosynthesis
MNAITPLVSICIPNYNNAQHVSDAIDSALNQTYPNIEVIIVDNCSEDNSWEIVTSYGDKLRSYRNQRNMGMVVNFRLALQYAKGHYVTLLCSDDILFIETIDRMVEMLESNPDCSFAFGNVQYIGAKAGGTNFNFPNIVDPGMWIDASVKNGRNMAYLVGTVFKRLHENSSKTIVNMTFFDWYLWLRLGRDKALFLNDFVGSHRYHKFNQTNQLTNGIFDNYNQLKDVVNLAYRNNLINKGQFIDCIDNMTINFSFALFHKYNLEEGEVYRSIVKTLPFLLNETSSNIYPLSIFVIKIMLIKTRERLIFLIFGRNK